VRRFDLDCGVALKGPTSFAVVGAPATPRLPGMAPHAPETKGQPPSTSVATHESCGQCTPCREGTNWLESVLDRIERGQGRPQDADLLLSMSDNIGGKSLCALGDAAIGPVISSVNKFRDEYLHHIEHKSCLPETVQYRRLDMPVAAH
jgi:hypothetical protein